MFWWIFDICTYVWDVVWWTFRYNQLLQFVLLAVEKFWLCGMIHLASIYVKPYLMFVYQCFRVCTDECECVRDTTWEMDRECWNMVWWLGIESFHITCIFKRYKRSTHKLIVLNHRETHTHTHTRTDTFSPFIQVFRWNGCILNG